MLSAKPAGNANLYFIAHVLPPSINEAIQVMKEDLHQRFGCTVGLKSPAHITLVPPFWLAEEKETKLVDDLHQLAAAVAPFSLSTKNFSAFGKRTLFIAVSESKSLEQLKQAADAIFTGNHQYGLKKENRPFHPHITLATRDIKPAQFDAAWQLYGSGQFQQEWIAENVSLLKHNRKFWEVPVTAAMAK